MQDSYSFFNVLQQYFSGSVLLPTFVIALVWIMTKWKIEYKKTMIAILCGSILIFNEVVYRVFSMAGESITYYRLLWMFPIGFIIAVFVVENITRLKNNVRIIVVGIFLLTCYMFSKQNGEEWFAFPENIYQLNEDAIEVADVLMELTDGESTYLLDNGDLDISIRQYNPRIVYTNNLESGLWGVIEGWSQSVLGSDIIQATYDDRSKYLALRKDEPFVHKLVESAGHTLVAGTDNYQIYQVDYDTVYWDVEKRRELTSGIISRASIEYISVSDVGEKYGYVYISDFGTADNEEVYKELFEKIALLQPHGIIINSRLSENPEWYLKYEELLEEMQIPYYCNNQEFQVIEREEFMICMMDNADGISRDSLKKFGDLEKKDKPVILVLSSEIVNTAEEYDMLFVENDFVVQILSTRKGNYTKELLGTEILQYSVPVDQNQILNMIYFKDLDNRKVIN